MINYLIYKSSDLINKRKILTERDFIMEDNKIVNTLYHPGVFCYSDSISLSNFKDQSLLIKVKLTDNYILNNLDCDKLDDLFIGIGGIEFNEIFCSIINSKSKEKLEPAKKKKDWNWYSKNEDFLEDIVDNLDTTYSYLLPAIYKQYTKKAVNILKVANMYIILHPAIIIKEISSF